MRRAAPRSQFAAYMEAITVRQFNRPVAAESVFRSLDRRGGELRGRRFVFSTTPVPSCNSVTTRWRCRSRTKETPPRWSPQRISVLRVGCTRAHAPFRRDESPLRLRCRPNHRSVGPPCSPRRRRCCTCSVIKVTRCKPPRLAAVSSRHSRHEHQVRRIRPRVGGPRCAPHGDASMAGTRRIDGLDDSLRRRSSSDARSARCRARRTRASCGGNGGRRPIGASDPPRRGPWMTVGWHGQCVGRRLARRSLQCSAACGSGSAARGSYVS